MRERTSVRGFDELETLPRAEPISGIPLHLTREEIRKFYEKKKLQNNK
jgi:hypothetical protein